jgi:hypothetical protein
MFMFSKSTAPTFLSTARTFVRRFCLEARRDDGVIGLVIVIALLATATALIATTARQNKESEVRRLSVSSTSTKLLKAAPLSFFLTDPIPGDAIAAKNGRVPCPDTDMPPDGLENGTTSCTANTGVVPWITFQISEDDAVDAYGNYFTYVVSGTAAGREICASVANAYDTSLREYTGTLNDVTDTEVRLSTQTAGQGNAFYYAFISHGKNGLGGIAKGGVARSAPNTAAEINNCPSSNTNCTDATPLAVISGPKDSTNSSYFDDTVYLSSRAQLVDVCEGVTPAQKVNAFVNEDFSGTTVGALPSTLSSTRGLAGAASVQESTVTAGSANPDLVLRLGGTTSGDIVTPAAPIPTDERPTYISFEWKPTALEAASQAGISIGFRGTAADFDTGADQDLFDLGTTDGLTLRFYEDNNTNANGALANRIYLCDDVNTGCDNSPVTDNVASSGADTFTIAVNQVFRIEAYDDGVNIWARITQVSSPANTATLSYATVPVAQQDLARGSSFFLINNGASTSEVDDLLIGRGAMAVAFDGTDDIVETSGDSHDTTTGNLTLSAWVYPDVLPSGSARSIIMSKWTDSAATAAGQAYRLYLTNGGRVSLDIAADDAVVGTNIITATYSFSSRVNAAEWTSLAVTFDASTQSASLYVNGELSETISLTTLATTGVNDGSSAFSIGAERNNALAIVNELDGNITDVRVWNTVRTATQHFTTYKRRLALVSGGETGLIANWTLDRDTDRVFSSTTATATAASTAGATGTLVNNAAFVPVFQTVIPAFSTSFCPAATIVGPYQCDFRSTSQNTAVSIPNNVLRVYVKAWGAGGGGFDGAIYDSSGGGGGHSQAQLRSINGTAVIGNTIAVDVGAGGTGSATGTPNSGAGGGGASGVWQDNVGTDFAGVVAGGGGGASNGDDNNVGGIGSFDCNAVNDCGPGGGGGGPANISGVPNVATTRAPDDAENVCGGRGGDTVAFGANPPGSNACESGGADPTSNAGASGGGARAGGASALGAGGAGYNGTDTAGADSTGGGGGGGGVSTSAMTAGGGEAGGYDTVSITDTNTGDDGTGLGGGGGAGFADSAGTTAQSGAAGTFLTPGSSTTDPDYAPSYCNGTTCITNPGRGGETGSFDGKQGVVILKW